MKRVRVWRSAAQPPGETDHFSGEVRIQELNHARGEGEIEVLAVFFEPGVRTVPHTHATDQLLYFVAGEGVVGNGEERRLFRAGEMAVIPAGEWHWHGATRDSEMCHLSIRHVVLAARCRHGRLGHLYGGSAGRSVSVERGVYFDAWFPRHHNYHPAHPARRLAMIDDVVDYRATMLVWAALGGGSLALPYLEQEASQPIDERFRLYGFLNDGEFIAECHKRGIKVFGIVYDIQGWEFPVELSENEDRILSLNEPRGVAKRDWIGLREFSQNRYPNLWPPFESYFAGGLINSDGQRVTDLLEEACSRDIHGAPIHADLGGVPGSGALRVPDGPQQPGVARVPEGHPPDPDRRRGGRGPVRLSRPTDRERVVRGLLLQGLHERVPVLPPWATEPSA